MRASILKATVCTGSVLQASGSFTGENAAKVTVRFLGKLCALLNGTATAEYQLSYVSGGGDWLIQFGRPFNEAELDNMCRQAALSVGLERTQFVIEPGTPIEEIPAFRFSRP